MGIGNGGLRHPWVKNTGCVVAGLYIGAGMGGGVSKGALCGGMAWIWFVGFDLATS